VEAAHPFDPQTSEISPLGCPQSVFLLNTPLGKVQLQFNPIGIRSDCDPGTAGDFLHICTAPFAPVLATGPVYERAQPCGDAVDLRVALWTPTGVVPDASGRALVNVTPPQAGQCLLLGATTLIDGVESPAITAFAAGCVDQDGDSSWTCPTSCGPLGCLSDCHDRDPNIHPGAVEICNALDDDCDGAVDEGFISDIDFDFIPDCRDNCPTIFNPDQSDFDADGRGDRCDNCVVSPNPDQIDTDQDGLGDVCDNCPFVSNPSQGDFDSDSVGDVCDNCPNVPNSSQSNADLDPFGDACDTCPYVANPVPSDLDGDGVDDACDTCPTVSNPDQSPCACNFCGAFDIFVSVTGGAGGGVATVSWKTGLEHDLRGFNIVRIDNQGRTTRLNPVLIACQQCTTDLGASYVTPVPRQRGGHDLFVEMVHRDGALTTFGPAIKQ
jgi:hypothetical protein